MELKEAGISSGMHEDELDKNQLSVTAKLMESIVQKCSNIWLQKKRNHLFKELKEMVFKYNCQYNDGWSIF